MGSEMCIRDSDDCQRHGVQLVKTSDTNFIADRVDVKPPALVFYKGQISMISFFALSIGHQDTLMLIIRRRRA